MAEIWNIALSLQEKALHGNSLLRCSQPTLKLAANERCYMRSSATSLLHFSVRAGRALHPVSGLTVAPCCKGLVLGSSRWTSYRQVLIYSAHVLFHRFMALFMSWLCLGAQNEEPRPAELRPQPSRGPAAAPRDVVIECPVVWWG